jgi:tripartite-type tricarboxylate transporter receptor subunit TctC
MLRSLLRHLLVASALCPLTTATAGAEAMFEGKTVTIVTSTAESGGASYAGIAKALTRAMPAYLPGNPTMIVKAMPGAGNVLATNYMFNIAPKDGTTIAVIDNSIPLHQALGGMGVRYDARKFNWLGSTGTYNSIAYVWHTAGFKTIQDTMEREVILGGTGVGSSIVIYPTVMNNVLGTRFKIVLGYKGTAEIDLAMERGELQARTGSYAALISNHPEWMPQHKIDILLQIGSKRDKALPDVPLMTEIAKTDEQRQILKLISSPIALGRPYLAPPDVAADRVAILRQAFQSSLRDKGLLEEARKLDFEIDPVSGEEIAQVVNETIDAPATIIEKTKAALGEAKDSL